MSAVRVFLARLEQHPLLVRWRALPPRDRQALSAMLGFVVVVILYLGFWQPAAQQLKAAQSYFEQQRELYAYLQAHAPQVQGQAEVSALEPLQADQLQGVVSAAASEQGVQVERFDNEGDGGLQVSLQPTGFAPLLSWIKQLEARGVAIDQVSLARQGDGQLSSRLLLRPRSE